MAAPSIARVHSGPSDRQSGASPTLQQQLPSIGSVSSIGPRAEQPIKIDGSGFGQLAPYSGNSEYIELADLTRGWNAGWHEPGSPASDTVTLVVASWRDSEIILNGFAGDYGAVFDSGGNHYDFNLKSGDQVRLRVWNPQTSGGPAEYLLTVSE